MLAAYFTARTLSDPFAGLTPRAFGCGCFGYPTFEFYEGEALLASLSLHHAKSVRWRKGCWPGDGMLVAEGASFLVNWLADKGVKVPLQQVQADKPEAREEEK